MATRRPWTVHESWQRHDAHAFWHDAWWLLTSHVSCTRTSEAWSKLRRRKLRESRFSRIRKTLLTAADDSRHGKSTKGLAQSFLESNAHVCLIEVATDGAYSNEPRAKRVDSLNNPSLAGAYFKLSAASFLRDVTGRSNPHRPRAKTLGQSCASPNFGMR